MRITFGLIAGAAALAGCATGAGDDVRMANQTIAASGETAIPFIRSLSSVEWKAVSDRAAYVRGGNGDWYLVRTSNRCTRLRSALALGFDTSALDQLDRHGALLVQGQRCPVASVTRSDPPPKRSRA